MASIYKTYTIWLIKCSSHRIAMWSHVFQEKFTLHFRGMHCFYLQGWRVNVAINKQQASRLFLPSHPSDHMCHFCPALSISPLLV
jgi:hypothetical protein